MTYGLHDYASTDRAGLYYARYQLQSLVGAQLDWGRVAAQDAIELNAIADRYEATADAYRAAAVGTLAQADLLPSLFVPPRTARDCGCADHYARERVDFGAAPPGASRAERKHTRWEASKWERYLRTHPFERQRVEMMLGARIVPDGVNDGRLTLQPVPSSCLSHTGRANAAGLEALSMLHAIDHAACGVGPCGGRGYQGLMLGALAGLYGGRRDYGYDDYGYATGGGRRAGGIGGIGGIGGNDLDTMAVLNDPSLTVEDKVMLFLMLIMKRMDKEIQQQMEYIDKLQKKDGQDKNKKAGGEDKSSSVDIETMKLKRLIDKRSQMFDMLRQIIDKYNQTAKGIIDTMGR